MELKYIIRDEIEAKDKTECDLLQFVVPTENYERVLVIEGNLCLEKLQRILPRAEIYAVTTDLDATERMTDSDIQFINLDYREVPLDFAEKYFDYIIAPRALELCGNPQDIAAGLSHFLKETGFFLTSFLNVRGWKIIRDLMEGHYYYFCRHMFSREEMEKLLYASFYKSIGFSAIKKEAPPKLLEKLMTAGFDNTSDDLEVEVWLVKAGRSTPELAAIKSLYTAEVRKELSRLLHRIEYDVEREKSTAALLALREKEAIFPTYLAEFLVMTVIHRAETAELIAVALKNSGKDEEAEELMSVVNDCDFE